MFRFEVGAHILIKRADNPEHEPIEVEILGKAPNMIKALIETDGWFTRRSIHWLTSTEWFAIGRVKSK